MANSRRTCQFLVNHVITGSSMSARVPLGCSVILCRKFRANSVVPWKYRKGQQKDRNKKNRDNVYFIDDQVPPMHFLQDAIDCVRAYSLFGAEPIDVLLKLNMGEKKTKIGSLRGLLHLPMPVTPEQTILVFAEGEAAEQARQGGATIVGGVELIKQVEDKELEFDHCLSTLDFLPKIKHLPKILRSKMPNTRRGTATDDISGMLETFRHGETYAADSMGRIRHTVALTNFTDEQIYINIMELMKAVASHKTVTKEKFFERASIVIPPGPKLDLLLHDVMPHE